MKTKDELMQERQRMLDSVQGILDNGNGQLSTEASAEADRLLSQIDGVSRMIEAASKLHAETSRPANPDVARLVRNGSGMSATPGGRSSFESAGGPVFQDANGNRIFAKTGADRFSDRLSDGEIGAAIHNMLRGDMQNAQIGSTDSAGGYLMNPQMSGLVLDMARAASVCSKAGAITIPMNTSELTIAKVDSDATAYWRGETVAVTGSSMAFGRITLRAKTLAAIVPVSIEMLEDAANAPQIIEAALAAVLGQKLDAAGLYGTGAGAEPQGIKYASGTNSVTSVGTPTAGAATYAKVFTALKNILDANYPGSTGELSWIQNPRDVTNWAALADTTYQPLAAPPMVAAMKQYATTALPKTEGGGGAESSAIIGHFPSLAFGMRTSGVQIQILDSGTVNDGTDDWNATTQLMKFIRVYMRADVALLRPSWFSVLSGITSA
jgi:HK97 family phage major capsid protein